MEDYTLWMSALLSFSLFSFALTLIVNVAFLWLLLARPIKQLGSYNRFLMALIFTDIAYGVILTFEMPIILVDSDFFIITTGGIMATKSLGPYMAFGNIFGYLAIMAVTDSSFIYRYSLICRPHPLAFLRTPHGVLLYVVVRVCAIFFLSLLTFYFLRTTPEMDEHANQVFPNIIPYHFNETISIAVSLQFEQDNRPFWRSLCGTLAFLIPLYSTIHVIVYCGWKLHSQISATQVALSARTRSMQLRMLLLLIIQALCPLACQYAPSILSAMLALSGMPLGKGGLLITVALLLFPIINPVIMIYFLHEYRSPLLRRINQFFNRATPTSVHNKPQSTAPIPLS